MGKKIPMWQCLIVILAMIGLLVWSIIKDTAGEPHIALLLAAAVASVVAFANGWKWAYLEQGILASINRSMQAILILAIVGAMIASWMGRQISFTNLYKFLPVRSGHIQIYGIVPGYKSLMAQGSDQGASCQNIPQIMFSADFINLLKKLQEIFLFFCHELSFLIDRLQYFNQFH